MNEQKMTCANCGSPLEYVQGMPIVTCPYCHSRFAVAGNDQLTPVMGQDGVLFTAWIPAGWGYGAENDVRWISPQQLVTFNLQAGSQDASLWFFPKAFFRHGNSQSYGMHPLTMQNTHQYLPLEQYVPVRLQETFPAASQIQVQFVQEEPFASLAAQFLPEAGQHIKDPQAKSGMFQFSFVMNGQQYHGWFGTILVSQAQPQQTEEEPLPPLPLQPAQPGEQKTKAKMDFNFFMRGGILGAKMRGEEIPAMPGAELFQKANLSVAPKKGKMPSLLKGVWARGMDVILLTADERVHLYQDIFACFASNVRYGPGYLAAQQREAQAVNQIFMQGAMQNQQNQINASRRLSNTISQRNDMIMDTWNKKQAAQTRMSNNYSEAIRGVNSYTNTYGQTVEASVRYDHVYQNGTDYIASDNNLNLGPDWSELTRKK